MSASLRALLTEAGTQAQAKEAQKILEEKVPGLAECVRTCVESGHTNRDVLSYLRTKLGHVCSALTHAITLLYVADVTGPSVGVPERVKLMADRATVLFGDGYVHSDKNNAPKGATRTILLHVLTNALTEFTSHANGVHAQVRSAIADAADSAASQTIVVDDANTPTPTSTPASSAGANGSTAASTASTTSTSASEPAVTPATPATASSTASAELQLLRDRIKALENKHGKWRDSTLPPSSNLPTEYEFGVQKVKGDGACLFHSLATVVGETTEQVRTKICGYLSSSFVPKHVKESVEAAEGCALAEYCKRVGNSGFHGGATEIGVFEVVNNVRVVVFGKNLVCRKDGSEFEEVRAMSTVEHSIKRPTVFLVWSGDHYDPLFRSVSSPSPSSGSLPQPQPIPQFCFTPEARTSSLNACMLQTARIALAPHGRQLPFRPSAPHTAAALATASAAVLAPSSAATAAPSSTAAAAAAPTPPSAALHRSGPTASEWTPVGSGSKRYKRRGKAQQTLTSSSPPLSTPQSSSSPPSATLKRVFAFSVVLDGGAPMTAAALLATLKARNVATDRILELLSFSRGGRGLALRFYAICASPKDVATLCAAGVRAGNPSIRFQGYWPDRDRFQLVSDHPYHVRARARANRASTAAVTPVGSYPSPSLSPASAAESAASVAAPVATAPPRPLGHELSYASVLAGSPPRGPTRVLDFTPPASPPPLQSTHDRALQSVRSDSVSPGAVNEALRGYHRLSEQVSSMMRLFAAYTPMGSAHAGPYFPPPQHMAMGAGPVPGMGVWSGGPYSMPRN